MTRSYAWALAALTLVPHVAGTQSVVQRTPNLPNGWTPVRGVVQLNFTHRFDMSDAPLRKITNTPTFQVATGVSGAVAAGFTYGSNSDLVAAYPNEWEWFARLSALSQDRGAPLDASLQGGWNVAAESMDTELSVARTVGSLRLLGAARAFQHPFYEDGARYAVAGGASLRILPWLTVAGDYASLIQRQDAERPVWGAGVQLSLPGTPHSLSVHAVNVGTGTMEGGSRGSATRWGFEYTVPITLWRYVSRGPAAHVALEPEGAAPGDAAAALAAASLPAGDTVVVTIRNFRFDRDTVTIDAGDVVVWRNADPVDHVMRADRLTFESPVVTAGGTWAHRFTRPGTYSYHCKPHPFMKAEIRVRESTP